MLSDSLAEISPYLNKIFLPMVYDEDGLYLLAIPSYGRTLTYLESSEDPLIEKNTELVRRICSSPLSAGKLSLNSGLAWEVSYTLHDLKGSRYHLGSETKRGYDLGIEFIPLETIDQFINKMNPSIETVVALMKIISLELKVR